MWPWRLGVALVLLGSLPVQQMRQHGQGHWARGPALRVPRALHTATLVSGDRVLVIGGAEHECGTRGGVCPGPPTPRLAELLLGKRGTWLPAGHAGLDRVGQTATLLGDGGVLVAGGIDGACGASTCFASRDARLFHPATTTWTPAGLMDAGRVHQTATLLPNGEVLVAGGAPSSPGLPLASAEELTPSRDFWKVTGSMAEPRLGHTATRLPDGQVLVVGGRGLHGLLRSAERYNPGTGRWSPAGRMSVSRWHHTATRLRDGRVLVAGGQGPAGYLASAELYNPESSRWSSTGRLRTARGGSTATLLPTGEVLVVGGRNRSGALSSAELYNPRTGRWSSAGHMAISRFNQSATLLPDGRVLIVGGCCKAGSERFLTETELYTP